MTKFFEDRVEETTWKPYNIGNLPKEFGCREFNHNGKFKIGMSDWLKFKGLTYVKITN